MIDSVKKYKMGDSVIYANRNVNFKIEKGEFVVMVGASGAGKSTVLNILGGMDKNDYGKVLIDGKDISKFTETELTTNRRYDIGLVYHYYNIEHDFIENENVIYF